jgi:hypothetical protein
MDNRIRSYLLHDMRLDPVEADVWVSVCPERLTSTTQVRGRLNGPRCPYTTTVEVAYALREHNRHYETEGERWVISRVVIPEPSLWDPQTPFLYEGPLELWQSGTMCEQVRVRHGLRKFHLGSRGLEINGKPLPICGIRRAKLTDPQARLLHEKGINALLPVGIEDESLWDNADRWGFVTIQGLANTEDLKRARSLKGHPSCLGYLVTEGPQFEHRLELAALTLADPLRGHYVGVEFNAAPATSLPNGISFLVCEAKNLAKVEQVPLPKLVLLADRDGAPDLPLGLSSTILGWVSQRAEG